MKDEMFCKWIESNQEWLLIMCINKTRDKENGKELKAIVLEQIWKYRKNYKGSDDRDEIQMWTYGFVWRCFYQFLKINTRKFKESVSDKKFTYALDKFYIHNPYIPRWDEQLIAQQEIENLRKEVIKKLSLKHWNIFIASKEDDNKFLNRHRVDSSEKYNISKDSVRGYTDAVQNIINGKTKRTSTNRIFEYS